MKDIYIFLYCLISFVGWFLFWYIITIFINIFTYIQKKYNKIFICDQNIINDIDEEMKENDNQLTV
jgi:hypothetical protein